MIRIGREERKRATDRQTDSLQSPQNGSQVSTKGRGTFSKLSLDSSVSWALWFWHTRLECQPPSCRNLNPNWKNPSKNFIEAEAYLSFCSTQKKDLHIYNLILQRKLFFHPTSLLIYDIVNPLSFNPEGLAYFFHRYVLLVYFIPIDAKHKSFT